MDISALFVKSHTRGSAEDGPLVIEINRLIIDRRQDGERAAGLRAGPRVAHTCTHADATLSLGLVWSSSRLQEAHSLHNNHHIWAGGVWVKSAGLFYVHVAHS